MMELKDLCGIHILSGVELGTEEIESYWAKERNFILFTLDGVTYKAVDDPGDGNRSMCENITVYGRKPCLSFDGIKVLCHIKEDDDRMHYNSIVMRDIINGKIVIEAGMRNTDGFYPHCFFKYIHENMACNADVNVND